MRHDEALHAMSQALTPQPRRTSEGRRKAPLGCVCAECGEQLSTPTEHMVHVIVEHASSLMGRGRTERRPWSCWCCAHENPITATRCEQCDWLRHDQQEATS